MKTSEMELLIRVAESGSMTRSARQLNQTPASVSATVSRVEKAMGVRIFERNTRSIRVTSEGLAVLQGCRDVLHRWQQTLDEVEGAGKELMGTVRLSAPADTTYGLVAPVLASLSEKHPKMQIVMHSSDIVQHLHQDAIDMAIRYGAMEDSSLLARKLAQCHSVLVASPAYLSQRGKPTHPRDLDKHRLVTLQLSGIPETSWTLYREGTPVELSVVSPLCGDGYLARQWALAGLGIARKSLFDVVGDLESGRLCRVLPEYTSDSMAIHAVFPSHRYLPSRVRAVDQALARAFSEHVDRCDAWLAQ